VFSVEDAAGNSRARERVDGLKKNQAASETRHTGVSALRASPIDRTADHWLTPAAIASRLCEPVRTNAKHKQQETRYSCVPACLRIVLAHLGLTLTETELRTLCDCTPFGTDALKAVDAVRQLGFSKSVS
jgi:hypothetical protein